MNSDPTYPGERHVRIPDKWFNDNPGGVFIIEPIQRGQGASHDRGNFMSTKILIGAHESDSTKAPSSNSATVRGYLHGENESDMDDWELEIGVVHDLRFRAIHADTDGRKIKIIGA